MRCASRRRIDGRQAHCGRSPYDRSSSSGWITSPKSDARATTPAPEPALWISTAWRLWHNAAGTGFVARTRIGLRQDSPHPGGNSKGQTQSGFRAKRIATDAPSGTCKHTARCRTAGPTPIRHSLLCAKPTERRRSHSAESALCGSHEAESSRPVAAGGGRGCAFFALSSMCFSKTSSSAVRNAVWNQQCASLTYAARPMLHEE